MKPISLRTYLTQLRNCVDTQQWEVFEDLLFRYRVIDQWAIPEGQDRIEKANALIAEMALECIALCRLISILDARLDQQEERIEDLERMAVREPKGSLFG